MLKSADEMRAETEEVIENSVMKQINEMALQKEYEAIFSASDIPEWLVQKLANFNYALDFNEELDLITVSWGQRQDAE